MQLKLEDPQLKFIAMGCMEDMCTCIARMYILCAKLGIPDVSFKDIIQEFITFMEDKENDELPY